MKRNRFGSILALLFAIALAGCSAGGMKMQDIRTSGFLSNYDQLKPGGEGQAALRYVDPAADFKIYTKLMFSRVQVVLSADADSKAVDPAVLKELTEYYQKALLDSVKGAYKVVDTPGPDVLWVKFAITDVSPSKPAANTLSTILPVGWVVAGTTKLVSDDNLGTGEAASEMEILDSRTGKRLAAAVDRRQGGKAVFEGKWNDTRDAFDYWAKTFRQRLDEMTAAK